MENESETLNTERRNQSSLHHFFQEKSNIVNHTVLISNLNKKYTFRVSGPNTFVSQKLFSPALFTQASYKAFSDY